MPLDRGTIDQQLQALGEGSRWWDQRELRDLPAVLHADEQILAISRGRIARARWLRRSWLIVLTGQRLLFVHSGRRTSWRQLEVNVRQISRVSLRVGPFSGKVLVLAGGQTYRLLVPRADAYRLQSALVGLATSAGAGAPGFAPMRMVHRVIDHVLTLPAAAFAPEASVRSLPAPPSLVPQIASLEERVQFLERELERLHEHVEFLEELLRQRHDIGPRSLTSRGEA